MKASSGTSTEPNWRMRFLPSFCFSKSFFARYVAAIALCRTSLRMAFDRFARDNLAADGRLHRDFKELARNVLLEVFHHFTRLGIGPVGMQNKGKRVDQVAVEQNVQLDKVALPVADKLIVKRRIAARTGFQAVEKS